MWWGWHKGCVGVREVLLLQWMGQLFSFSMQSSDVGGLESVIGVR